MDLITILVAVVYLGLAVHTRTRARSTQQEALGRLSAFLLAIAVVASSVPLLGEGLNWLPVLVLLGGLAGYPALLLRFGAAVTADGRRLEHLALVVLGVEAVVMGAVAVLVGGEGALLLDMVVAGGFAVAAHLVVHVVLRRQASAMPSSFVRRRARALEAGLGLLAASLAVGIFATGSVDVPAEAALVGAAVAALLLSTATAPPRWLQTAFILPDYDRLMVAEEAIATAEEPDAAVLELLEGLVQLLAGSAAWLLHDGDVVATVGTPPGGAVGRGDTLARRTEDGDGWVLAATSRHCELGVVAGRDPVLYGLDVADLLPRTVRRVAVALEGREVDSQRRATELAEQEAEHYRRTAALKDDLLSTINHELRTPIGVVTGALELVRARWEDLEEEQRRTLVERADANAQDLAEVVLEVLALVELRSGVTRAHPRRTALAAVVDAALGGLPLEGRVEVCVPDHEALVDPDLASRVLRQLVDNALAHTSGAVEVEAAVDPDADTVVLVVRDRGDGVGPDLAGAFARGGHYLHRTTRGLGLGLTLATETAVLLGGTVTVEPGAEGTTATCRLPHAAAVTAPTTTRDTSATAAAASAPSAALARD